MSEQASSEKQGEEPAAAPAFEATPAAPETQSAHVDSSGGSGGAAAGETKAPAAAEPSRSGVLRRIGRWLWTDLEGNP